MTFRQRDPVIEPGASPVITKRDTLMKITTKTLAVTAVALLALTPSLALAQNADVGAIADSLASQTTSVTTLITIASFAIGVFMAVAGFLKFRANSQNPNDPSNKLSTAFMLIFVGAALVALPTVIGTGIGTIFGDGATSTDGTAGFQQLN